MYKIFGFIILGLLVLMSACEEVPPAIDFTVPLTDTSYVVSSIPAKQDKVVLIEEFSGVTCVNCPGGNAFVEDLIEKHEGRVITATLHAGSFATPLNISNEDFEIEETAQIDGMLGVTGYPAAAVDRIQFAGDGIAMTSPYSNWEAATEQQLEKTTPVNIDLSYEYDETENILKVRTVLTYTEDIQGNHNLSLFLVESKIIDPQLSVDAPGGLIKEYEHNHVVRDMLTSSSGVPVNNVSIVEGLTVIKEYELNILESWNVDNCAVIAFVHKTGQENEIIHSSEKKLNK